MPHGQHLGAPPVPFIDHSGCPEWYAAAGGEIFPNRTIWHHHDRGPQWAPFEGA